MRLLSIIELKRLSKIELCDLAARITNCWPEFPEGSPERFNALTNLATSAASWRGEISRLEADENPCRTNWPGVKCAATLGD